MSQELSEPRPEVLVLRQAMDRVRAIQEASSLAVSLARYDAETEPINNEFMEDFLEILPVKFEYTDNRRGDTSASSFVVKDALNVRPTAVFGIHFLRASLDRGDAGLIVGERSSVDPKLPLTEILVLGLRRKLNEDDTWSEPYPVVTPFAVATGCWEKLRREAIDSLTTPYSQDTFTHLFSSTHAGYLIDKATVRSTGMARLEPTEYYYEYKDKKALRQLKRTPKGNPNTLVCQIGKTRLLQSTDIEMYGVMNYLEYITAAYDKSTEFDFIKAKRTAALPNHPVDKTLEEPHNRQALDAALGELSLQKHAGT